MSSTSPDLPRTAQRALAIVALALTVAAGCDSCCAEPLANPNDIAVCALDTTCEEGDAFRYGICDSGGCGSDADCCPGTRCRTDLNVCFPRLLDSDFECETSADCADPAQVCASVSVGGREPLPTCIYESCAGDSDCGVGSGRSCYAGHCVTNTPCGGACPAGSVCEINTNSCHTLPDNGNDANGGDTVDKSCSQECTNGLLVLANEDTMSGEICCGMICECEGLPPVVPTRVGRYARVAVTPAEVLVSAYDAEFGDLVVARFDLSGGVKRFDYIDGVPAEAPSSDPNGPRGGVRGVGIDVGTHTGIATDSAGLGRVAYHDVTGNALKVAIEGPIGVWRTHFVDGAANPGVGQTGTFTDVAVANTGIIFVSYLAHDTTLAGVTGQATGVKLARSRNPAPQSAADWEFFVVDARPFTVDPAARVESPELPRGRGLHTSIALDGDAAVIGYYDATDGDVRVARFQGTAATITVLDGDGQGGRIPGDVGRYPAVGIAGTDLLVAYEDSARHTLRFWKGPKDTPGTGGAYGVADALREANRSGSHFIGAGARLSTEGTTPVLVHQDASTLDLRFATLQGAAFSVSTVLSEGAHGFYADVAVSGGKAYVCSVVAQLDARGKERSQVRLDVQQIQ
ncbi:MAG: hypothetical protein Q8O67_10105 [Deltaproteobacteria bacterium]|nr:hypothetical protein [Deltaproteobacteria bacterium]